MRKFRQGDAPVILYSRNGVKLFDFDRDRIIETDDEDLINLLLAMGAVEIPPDVPPVPQDLTEVAARINALTGRVTATETALSAKVDRVPGMGLSTVDYSLAAATKLQGLADIRTIGDGLDLAEGELSATGSGSGSGSGTGGDVTWADIKNKPDNLATTEDVDAKVFVAEYNVTTAQKIRDYLDSSKEPFAPVVVKRGNDYYTAALATKSGDDAAILRVLGSGGGNYILFNYTVRGTAWSSNSYTFQKQLVSGTDIKTVDGKPLLGAGNLATAPDWANVANKPAGLVEDAAYVHTDSNYTAAEKTKLAGLANYDDAPLAARVSTLENAGYQTAQDVDDKIGEALETFDKLDYKVADSPPTPTTVVIKGKTETTQPGVRYMVKHTTDARYEEYILIDGAIYDIGDTGNIDLSGYATTAAMNTALDGKQATLVSGENIKTLGGVSLLGSGNIPISGGSGNSFLITKGTTTYAQLVANKSQEMWFVDPAETTFAPRPVIACVVREASQQVLITVQKTTASNEVWQVGSNNAWSVVQTNQFLKLPQYQLSNNDSGGNVIQKGEIVISGATYGLFEFYFQTGLLPAANATVAYSFANLLASYTIHSFVDATGMTDDGIFIGNGRTDNENRLIVQQFSKNSKNVTIRAYKDFSAKTALLKIQFIGTKN